MRTVSAPRSALLLLAVVACGRAGTPPAIDRLDAPESAAASLEEAALARTDGVKARIAGGGRRPGDDAEADAAIVIEDQPLPGSRKLLESATILAAPSVDAPALGVVASGTRLAVYGETDGEGCATPWLEVAPRGFVCARTQTSKAAPSDAMLPKLPRGAVVPGVYGKVADDAPIFSSREDAARGVGGRIASRKLTVHRLSRETVGGRAFWRTNEGWIPEAKIRRHRGSSFAGVRLAAENAPELPLAWVLARPGAERSSVPVLAMPRAGARVAFRMRPRTVVSVGAAEHGFVAVDGGWIAQADLRIAEAAEMPPGVGEGERWVDVDLGQQVLVAYEGTTPVYATMISSGRAGHRTPTGVYRIERKVAERTMNSMSDSDEEYSVAKVPWTAYFSKGYALHAAYWHDGFGRPRSHGCINLAPRDARELYGFVAPAAAPGWSEVYGHEAQPGTVVRVRSRRDPEPSVEGYALAMLGPEGGVSPRG